MSYLDYRRNASAIQAPGDKMSPTQDYSEDALVEQPAIALLAELFWLPRSSVGATDNAQALRPST